MRGTANEVAAIVKDYTIVDRILSAPVWPNVPAHGFLLPRSVDICELWVFQRCLPQVATECTVILFVVRSFEVSLQNEATPGRWQGWHEKVNAATSGQPEEKSWPVESRQ